MNEWIDEWLKDGWMNELVDGWVNEWLTDGRVVSLGACRSTRTLVP